MADVTVEPGNTLEVEYAVENFGDDIDTQDVRLMTNAPADIPDSAIHQWRFAESSGTTATDAIKSADGTIEGDPITADADAEGGYLHDYDGADDRALYTVDIGQYSEWMICFTLETSTTEINQPAWGWGENSSFGGQEGLVQGDSDEFQYRATDGSATVDVFSTTDITDGSKYRLACGLIENDQVFVAVDTTQEDTASFGTIGDISTEFATGYSPVSTNYGDVAVDHPIIYTDTSSQTIQGDYDAQPWT